MKKLIIALLGATILVSTPAVAATTDRQIIPYDSNPQGWEIDVYRPGNECGATRLYRKGTFFGIYYNREDNGYYLTISRDDWSERIQNGRFKMEVVTEGSGDRYVQGHDQQPRIWPSLFCGYPKP